MWSEQRRANRDGNLPAHTENTVQAIAELHADLRQAAGALRRVVERLTASIGRPSFIAAMTVAIVAWMGVNALIGATGRPPWNPGPFSWMQLGLGVLAIDVTALILITQCREQQLAGYRE